MLLTTVPARVHQVAARQMFGLFYGLAPLCLFFTEKALATTRWIWGLGAGTCLVLMGVMEPHVTYCTGLTLGL